MHEAAIRVLNIAHKLVTIFNISAGVKSIFMRFMEGFKEDDNVLEVSQVSELL